MVFPRTRQLDTRERLLKAMVDAVAERGYASVAVEDVLRHSGASRSTFYEQFTDKNDCFLAAQREIATRLLRTLELEARLDAPEEIHETVIRVLTRFATDEQPAARLLLVETLAAERRALDARDQLIRAMELIVDKAWRRSAPDTMRVEFSAGTLIGCVFRLLSIRMRRGEGALHGLQEDLIAWIEFYRASSDTPVRWRKLSRGAQPQLLLNAIQATMPDPQPLPRGRHRLSAPEVARNQCDRILYAVAELAYENGYAPTTVTHICTRSRVSRKVFYTHYEDKQAAALDAHELGFQQALTVTSKGFFSGPTWPERVWAASCAFTRFLVDYPTIAWLGFVESYAIGPAAVQRAEDSLVGFSIFLEEGYQHCVAAPPPRITLEAISAAVFELIYHELRHKRLVRLSGLIPDVLYICLAPFLGQQEATRFIDSRLEQQTDPNS